MKLLEFHFYEYYYSTCFKAVKKSIEDSLLIMETFNRYRGSKKVEYPH